MKAVRHPLPPSTFLPSCTAAARRQGSGLPFSRRLPLLLAGGLLLPGPAARAAELTASDGARDDYFGTAVSRSGNIGLIGAYYDDLGSFADRGSAYLFRNVDTANGTITEIVRLFSLQQNLTVNFGLSASISGNIALIGADGEAYLFRNLDTVTQPEREGDRVTEDVRLFPTGSVGGFGQSVSISGTIGLIGANGTVHVYRNLDTVIDPEAGFARDNAILTASDRGSQDQFGYAVSLSGTIALVGAYNDEIGTARRRGSAYLFRNLDTATGTVRENAKLTASDGAGGDYFGTAVSLSGTIALVGAGSDDSRGSAYLFRNLDTATGGITEAAKLTASDRVQGDQFGGFAVSLSGNTGLVSAYGDDGTTGSAYFFRNLDTATGTITENVKVTASDRAAGDQFGVSGSLEGDRFVIGARLGDGAVANSGSAYTGRVSAFTTLDEGGATRTTDRLSFISREDWVIGGSTDGNQNTLSAGDSGTVSTAGKAVYVGRAAGADHNALTVDGTLTANSVQVGAAGNTGNALRISNGGKVTNPAGSPPLPVTVSVAAGSSVGGDGTLTGNLTLASGALFAFLPSATLTVTGSVALPAGFGVTGLLGLDGGTPAGTYPLIDGTATNFATLGLSHWGQANAHAFGGGKTAWFQQQGAGLQLVVAGTGTGTVELPALNVSRSGGQLTLTWTTTLTGLIPETSPTLTGGWQAVTTAPAQSGNTWTLTVPVPVSDTRRFYRLRRP